MAAAKNGGSRRNGGNGPSPSKAVKKHTGEPPVSRQETLEYIAAMLGSMKVLAEQAGLAFLSRLIAMAQLEADSKRTKRD